MIRQENICLGKLTTVIVIDNSIKNNKKINRREKYELFIYILKTVS